MTPSIHRSLLPTPASPVVIHYADAQGRPQFTTPTKANAVEFEAGRPVRKITRYRDQTHTPGVYWCAKDGQQHDYESYLESQWMTMFDFDPAVVAMRAQPFLVQCLAPAGGWEHTPDLFLRLADGRGRVVDVKNPRQINDTEVILQAARTREVCEWMGFDYRLVAEPEPIPWSNVKWLAGYRRPFDIPTALTEEVLMLAASPVPIGDLTQALEIPELARTAVLRACWFGQLQFDLDAPLRDRTYVQTKEAR